MGSLSAFAERRVQMQCSFDNNTSLRLIIETSPSLYFIADTSGFKLDATSGHNVKLDGSTLTVTKAGSEGRKVLDVDIERLSGTYFSVDGSKGNVSCH
jgi:hypothetical protein